MDSNEGPNIHKHDSKILPKNPLKHLKTIIEIMQRRAEQGTFGGRFGGRKALQSRKSCTFGGTFGGRRFPLETKIMHVRRHLRRPKLPSKAESQLSRAGFDSQRLASTGRFGGQKSLRLPNLSSFKGQNLASTMHICLPTPSNSKPTLPQHAYTYT